MSDAIYPELQHRYSADPVMAFHGEPEFSARETRIIGSSDQYGSMTFYDLQGMTACAAPPFEIWFIQLLLAVLREHWDDASA